MKSLRSLYIPWTEHLSKAKLSKILYRKKSFKVTQYGLQTSCIALIRLELTHMDPEAFSIEITMS